MTAYNFKNKVHNWYIIERATKGIYGLPQAGRITHDNLIHHLSPYLYHPKKNIPGIWTHDSRPINFNLAVDDSRVKYDNK